MGLVFGGRRRSDPLRLVRQTGRRGRMVLLGVRRLVCGLLFLVMGLVACTAPPRDPFAYAQAPFSLWIEGGYAPLEEPGAWLPLSAHLWVGPPRGYTASGLPLPREMTLSLLSPATLRGVTVTATPADPPEGGGRRVTFSYVPLGEEDVPLCGEVELVTDGGELDGFLDLVEVWLPTGEVVEVTPVGEDGCFTVLRRRETGERVTFLFAKGEALPLSVILTDSEGRVLLQADRRGDLPREEAPPMH